MANFDFVGFDGNSYSLPSFNKEMLSYEAYIILYNNGTFRFLCFNGELQVYRSLNQNRFVALYDSTLAQYTTNTKKNKWSDTTTSGSFIGTGVPIIYCSSNLMTFKDKLLNSTDDFLLKPVYLVLPIVFQDQEDIPYNIFIDIFGVLPILLVMLVGLIGLRRGITFLFSLLRRS